MPTPQGEAESAEVGAETRIPKPWSSRERRFVRKDLQRPVVTLGKV